MNKREAEAIARDITRHGLTVTGFRRYENGKRGASWAVDVQDTTTGYTFTVDEPGQWHERQSQYGNLAADDKPTGRPTTYGQTMLKRTVLMPPAMWGWVEATGAGNVSAGIRQAVDAVSLLSREQWAWLTRRDDAPAALEDAVRQALDMQRAEAEADATVDGYSTGRW